MRKTNKPKEEKMRTAKQIKKEARERFDEKFDFGFPFGKATIKEILRSYRLHIQKPFSEVFEFYTADYVIGAIKKYQDQTINNTIKQVLEGVRVEERNLNEACKESNTNCIDEDLPACTNCSEGFGFNQAVKQQTELAKRRR